MRRLMLLRHAKSDWSRPGERDHDRMLAARGRAAAPRIGAYMAAHGFVPDLVVCSTARRARETWEAVATGFDVAPPVTFEPRVYEASAGSLLSVARQWEADAPTVLLIGHNPALQDFANMMIATGDLDEREQLHEKFPTAGLAVIDFPIESWAALHPKSGRLSRFITPRLLESAPD